MPDPFNLTTEQQVEEARAALRSSDVAGAAAYASLAAVDMLQQLLAIVRNGTESSPEPKWQTNDLVRYRHERSLGGDAVARTTIVYLVQRPEGSSGGRFWHAMVMRVEGPAEVIVGESGLLDSTNPDYQVARFPD